MHALVDGVDLGLANVVGDGQFFGRNLLQLPDYLLELLAFGQERPVDQFHRFGVGGAEPVLVVEPRADLIGADAVAEGGGHDIPVVCLFQR